MPLPIRTAVLQLLQLKMKLLLQQLHIVLKMALVMIAKVFISSKRWAGISLYYIISFSWSFFISGIDISVCLFPSITSFLIVNGSSWILPCQICFELSLSYRETIDALKGIQLTWFQPGAGQKSAENIPVMRGDWPIQQFPERNSSGRKEARVAGREKELQDTEKGNNSWRRNERVWPQRHQCRGMTQGASAPSASNLLKESPTKGTPNA